MGEELEFEVVENEHTAALCSMILAKLHESMSPVVSVRRYHSGLLAGITFIICRLRIKGVVSKLTLMQRTSNDVVNGVCDTDAENYVDMCVDTFSRLADDEIRNNGLVIEGHCGIKRDELHRGVRHG